MRQAVLRLSVMSFAVFALLACATSDEIDRGPADLGNFRLGHNVVVAPDLRQAIASREATPEEWTDAMQKAVDERLARYDGSKLYHLGMNVETYLLAVPGVPVVASPKSLLVFNLTVWDDAAG
ncbi:MAG: hypothetical protein AAF678_03865, partial [Pseudomonadota bacterium]